MALADILACLRGEEEEEDQVVVNPAQGTARWYRRLNNDNE